MFVAIVSMAAIFFTALSILFQLLDFLKTKHRRWFAGLAIASSLLALLGQWHEHREANRMQAEIDSIGVEQTEWFQVTVPVEKYECVLSSQPLPDSISVRVNGLIEQPDEYWIENKNIWVTYPFRNPPNKITITYRHKR